MPLITVRCARCHERWCPFHPPVMKDAIGSGVLGAGAIARKVASDLRRVRTRVPDGSRGAWPLINALNLAVIVLWAAAMLVNGAGTPAFVTSEPNGGWSSGGYYVHNNLWNRAKYNPCTSTLSAWSPDNWQVVTRMNNRTGDGAVKTYPNVHRDYDRVPIDSFDSLTSHFAATGPRVGIYNVAYDIWINGIAKPGCTEIMIWTENFNQVPGGKYMQEATFGSHTYKAYRNAASGYIAFVTTTNFTSGTVNLLDIMKWTTAQGWLPEKSTLNQICFGIEMVSTDDTDATFRVTAFSIDSRVGAGAKPPRPEPGQALPRPSGADNGATAGKSTALPVASGATGGQATSKRASGTGCPAGPELMVMRPGSFKAKRGGALGGSFTSVIYTPRFRRSLPHPWPHHHTMTA